MQNHYFNYLKNFRCSADKCRHSCCEKWEIDIDKRTCRKYKKYKGTLKTDFENEVDFTAKKFKMHSGRCAFLCDDGLCKIIKQAGESYLSEVCAFHPRMKNRFKRFTEVYLSISCEEAAKLILASPDFYIAKPSGRFARFVSRPTKEEKLILGKRENLINRIKTGDFINGINVIEDFVGIGKIEIKDFILPIKSAEYVDREWTDLLLGADKPDAFEIREKKERLKRFDENLKALLIYFLYGYASGAKSEFEFLIRAVLSLVLTEFIAAVFILQDDKHNDDKRTSFDMFLNVAREVSREIEFSNENLDNLYDFSEEYYFKKLIIKEKKK